MATDNIKNFNDFLDRMQEIIYETRKQFEIEDGKPFDYENATIVQNDFAPVKHKFENGDWIVFNDHTFYIKEVGAGFYETISLDGIPYKYDWCIDNMARLWTVEDAREGDVLTDYCNEYENPLIFILKKFEHVDFGLVRPSDYSSYCFLTMGNRPRFKEGNFHHMHDVKPATEEQRDTLMKAMHEAGYTFDFEKKELKKVESKFHVGDWVVDSQGLTHQIGGVVENVTTHTFGYDIVGGGYFNDDTEGVHLWTIQDAKEGDVLVDTFPFIFKRIDHLQHSYAYCGISVYGFQVESEADSGEWTWSQDIKPATKEQRDLLFQKMREAGYEWDAEKKGLRKIEQSPAWSKEDEDMLESAIGAVGISDYYTFDDKEDIVHWLKYIKNRIQAKQEFIEEGDDDAWSEEDEDYFDAIIAKLEVTQDDALLTDNQMEFLKSIKNRVKPQTKQKWGEDDEKLFSRILDIIHNAAYQNYDVDVDGEEQGEYAKIKRWLKSIKERYIWKPTDEQLKALDDVISSRDIKYDVLSELWNDLKKLKE